MKKITLASILIFISISVAIFIVNVTSTTTDSAPNTSISKSIKANQFNDLNINISQLTFKLNTAAADTFTTNEIAKHNTRSDCYLIINNNVYDVSDYISYHPGGSRTITSRCGKEVTSIFARIHSNRAWDLLKKYKVGTIKTNQADTTPQMLNAIETALKDANPTIDVIKVSPKQDFYIAKLIFNHKLYEIHINNSGKIIKEEVADDESNWFLWENDRDDR